MAETLQILIPKGKGYIEVNTDPVEQGGDLTSEVYKEALIQGLKVILNRGMTKITKSTCKDEEEMKALAMKQARKTFEQMKTNDIKFTGAKKVKEISGEVMKEALDVARKHVKQWLKDQGVKLSHVKTAEITKHAKALLVAYPDIVEKAKATVAARKEAAREGLDLGTLFAGKIELDEELIKKDEAIKAERKAASSASKAGKVAFRPKPTAGPQVTAH